MTWFTHRSRHRNPRRILPGHGTPKKSQTSASGGLPGVTRKERQARRSVWTYNHARRFDQSEITNRFVLAIAVAMMLVGMMAALSGPSVLERAQAIQAEADAAQVIHLETPPNA